MKNVKGIRALAARLNMSIGTVSRALNGRPGVNERTRERVRRAADEDGYVANQSGRALREGKTGIVGFMIRTGSQSLSEGDTFFSEVFDGVQSVLARHDLDLVAFLCASQQDPYDYLRRIIGRGFADGLIISATERTDARIDLLASLNVPFVALGRSVTDRDHAWFDLDFEGMASAAVDRLVAKGHRRIAVALPEGEYNFCYVFLECFKRSLAQHRVALPPDLVLRFPPNEAGGYRLAQRLTGISQRPTAVVLIHELMTVGLYRGLLEAGVVPGRDLAVIGRDSPHARFLSPTLTCFRTSLRDLGAELAKALLATMPAYQQAYPQGMERRLWPLVLAEGESDALEAATVQGSNEVRPS